MKDDKVIHKWKDTVHADTFHHRVIPDEDGHMVGQIETNSGNWVTVAYGAYPKEITRLKAMLTEVVNSDALREALKEPPQEMPQETPDTESSFPLHPRLPFTLNSDNTEW